MLVSASSRRRRVAVDIPPATPPTITTRIPGSSSVGSSATCATVGRAPSVHSYNRCRFTTKTGEETSPRRRSAPRSEHRSGGAGDSFLALDEAAGHLGCVGHVGVLGDRGQFAELVIATRGRLTESADALGDQVSASSRDRPCAMSRPASSSIPMSIVGASAVVGLLWRAAAEPQRSPRASDELWRRRGDDRPPVSRERRSGQVEAVEVHDLGPRRGEVLHELLLRVFASVDLGDGSELEFEPKTRSTAVPVHLTLPVSRSWSS